MSFTISPLRLPTGALFANGLGCSGDGSIVVGNATIGGNVIPVEWSTGTPIILPLLPGGTVATANKCSQLGHIIVGSGNDAGAIDNATTWVANFITALPSLVVGKPAHAIACDKSGAIIIGDATDAGNNPHAVVWMNGVLSTLPSLFIGGGNATQGEGCSGDGQTFVGYSTVQFVLTHVPVFWRSGAITILPPIGGTDSGVANDANDDGTVIVGYSSLASIVNPPFFATIWRGGVATQLPSLPGAATGSLALAVSGDGSIVVGQSDDGVNTWGVVWRGGTVTKLPRIDGSTDIFPNTAVDINYAGNFIVGGADDASGTLLASTWSATLARQLPSQPLAWKAPPRPFLPVAQGIR